MYLAWSPEALPVWSLACSVRMPCGCAVWLVFLPTFHALPCMLVVLWVAGLSDPTILFLIAISRVLALDMMIGAFFNMTWATRSQGFRYISKLWGLLFLTSEVLVKGWDPAPDSSRKVVYDLRLENTNMLPLSYRILPRESTQWRSHSSTGRWGWPGLSNVSSN